MKNPFEIIDERLINIENLLLDLKYNDKKEILPAPSPPGSDFSKIPIKNIFDGKLLSRRTFYRHVRVGKIKLYKVGNRSYINRIDFENLFQEVKPTAVERLKNHQKNK